MYKKILIFFIVFVMTASGVIFWQKSSGEASVVTLKENSQGKSVTIQIEEGEHYLHPLKLFPLITIKTPPQMAIWLEDEKGNYLDTLYVTEKTVNGTWSKAPLDKTPKDQIKRKEALPYWIHKKEGGNLDAISSATTKGNTTIHTKLDLLSGQYNIYAEINSSTDFNEYYPKEAQPKDSNYSGGAWGSGQPAIIYCAIINAEKSGTYTLAPIGHSSPDGTDGKFYGDLSKLTTATTIVETISVTVE